MIKLVYQGIDSLDVSIMGAASAQVLEKMEKYRGHAEKDANNLFGFLTGFGQERRPFAVKGHGKKGGYRYTLVDQVTGTIVSIKNDQSIENWNIFISCRAHSLLSLGYVGMKAEIEVIMAALGVKVLDVSVNRIDQALDFLAPEFDLQMENFVVPRSAKVSPYFSSGHDLNDQGDRSTKDGLPVGSVMRGGRFETVTIGKMPGRQVTVYDKSGAAKAQQKMFWFPAWGLDPNDPTLKVWRIEFRAGREALKRSIPKLMTRTFESVENCLPKFLKTAADEIRYVKGRNETNVTRSELHPLWHEVQALLLDKIEEAEPPLTPFYVREMMRKQRADMALQQGFGNLNNFFILEKMTPSEIGRSFPRLVAEQAVRYRRDLGSDLHRKKLEASKGRNVSLLLEG